MEKDLKVSFYLKKNETDAKWIVVCNVRERGRQSCRKS